MIGDDTSDADLVERLGARMWRVAMAMSPAAGEAGGVVARNGAPNAF